MKFSRRIEDCVLSPIRKFQPYETAAAAAGRTVYHLNIGQPDVETPRAFFEAVRGFEESVLAYAPSPGVDVFLDAVRDYYAGFGVGLDRGDILATYGGSEALQMVFTCLLEDGDEVLVPEPYYPNYATFIRTTGAVIRPVPTSPEEGYRYASREKLEPLINEHTRAILITDPGNPTGVVLTARERRLLLDIAKERNLFLISDEVYRELIYSAPALSSMLSYPDGKEHVVVIDSVSKRFSATGSRVGTLISRNRELMNHAMKICQGRLCAATLDQIGAAALYRTMTPAYVESIRREYRARRDAVTEELAKIPGVRFDVPEGAFYLMASLPVDDAEKLQYFLLQEFSHRGETVMYAPGEHFYATPGRGRNEIRIAYVKNCDELRRSIQLLGLGIAAYNSRRDSFSH